MDVPAADPSTPDPAGRQPDPAELLAHTANVWAVTGRYFARHADREDAFQDAMLAAVRALGRFQGRCRLGTWLHRLAVNACLMKLRAEKRRQRGWQSMLIDHLASADRDPVAEVLLGELTTAVRSAIDTLPAQYREVIELRYTAADLSECAVALGVSTGVVKVRSHRARAVLRPRLESFVADGGSDRDA